MRPFNMIYDAGEGREREKVRRVARPGTGGLLEGTRNCRCPLRNSGILVFRRFVDSPLYLFYLIPR